jgi:hypothetical protein
MRRPCLAVAAVLALASCRPERPKVPELPAAFASLPTPPDATFLGRSGGSDVLMLTFGSPMRSDSVATYYRRLFKADTEYHVLNENAGAAGEVAFYVELSKRPMWIRIRPSADSAGSVVELTGAVVGGADTSAAPTPGAAAK